MLLILIKIAHVNLSSSRSSKIQERYNPSYRNLRSKKRYSKIMNRKIKNRNNKNLGAGIFCKVRLRSKTLGLTSSMLSMMPSTRSTSKVLNNLVLLRIFHRVVYQFKTTATFSIVRMNKVREVLNKRNNQQFKKSLKKEITKMKHSYWKISSTSLSLSWLRRLLLTSKLWRRLTTTYQNSIRWKLSRSLKNLTRMMPQVVAKKINGRMSKDRKTRMHKRKKKSLRSSSVWKTLSMPNQLSKTVHERKWKRKQKKRIKNYQTIWF